SKELMPEAPASRASQEDLTSPPRGVVAPNPVTTIFEVKSNPFVGLSLCVRDVVDYVAYGV
ncbi:MAG: hypothetical protein RIT51_728, partial [Actinomycetota bacterium]